MRSLKTVRGSITVEAAIVLPVFICVVISLSMLIKLVYVHDMIQHSIDEAANELATYAYIYNATDLQRIDEAVQDEMNSGSEQAEKHIDTIINAYDTLEKASKTIENVENDIDEVIASEASFTERFEEAIYEADTIYNETQQLTVDSIDNIQELEQALKEVSSDPRKEAQSLGWLLSKCIYSKSKTIIAVPLIKHTVIKYLSDKGFNYTDMLLKKLNVYKGLDGLDFYSSKLFDGDENIDIIVKYKIDLPLPIKILPDIYILQRSTARAWLEGGDGIGSPEINIWDLPNKERGIKIEKMYGGNLPYSFPVIDIYDAKIKAGTAIHSINLNSKTYQSNDKLNKQLKAYVDKLSETETLIYDKQRYDISSKMLIIVIPKGSLNQNNKVILDQISSYAATNKIQITINEL